MTQKSLSNYQRMFRTLRLIDIDPHELSHEKIRQQRDWFKRLAHETLQEVYKHDTESND